MSIIFLHAKGAFLTVTTQLQSHPLILKAKKLQHTLGWEAYVHKTSSYCYSTFTITTANCKVC